MIRVILKKQKDKLIRMGNPWVFSGAIARSEGTGAPGALCVVVGADNSVLGHGYYNPDSSIAVRMLTRGNRPFDEGVLYERIERAGNFRGSILGDDTTACRLVNSEGDMLPGLIVDRYGEGVCVQFLTAGMEFLRQSVLRTIDAVFKPAFIYERSDADVRKRERLAPVSGLVSGTLPEELVVRENGLRFGVDVVHGQKTGMFLDQRENRALVGRYSAGARVLDCFCYSGGFSVYALAGGASRVCSVDSSGPALKLASGNRERNGFSSSAEDMVQADVFEYLRQAQDTWSLIVLDPPKFARQARDVEKACRGYKDINLLALRRAHPGALLFTYSCSQAVDVKLFRQVIFAAAADSGRAIQVLHVLSQGPDHPVNIAHREGEYLKGLVVRVVSG